MKMAELLPLHYTFISNNETEQTSTLTVNHFFAMFYEKYGYIFRGSNSAIFNFAFLLN